MKIHRDTLYRVAKIIRKLEKKKIERFEKERKSTNRQPMLCNKRRFVFSCYGEQYMKYCVISRIFRGVGIQNIATILESAYGFIRYISNKSNIKQFNDEYFEIINDGNTIILKNHKFQLELVNKG